MTVTPLGRYENSMRLIITDGQLEIEWLYWPVGKRELEEVTYIGITIDDTNELTDYDGVFELPKEAIHLLTQCKITISDDF